MEDIKQLQSGFDQAVKDNDGFLIHWFGSQIWHYHEFKKRSEQHRKDFDNRLEQLKQECDDRVNDMFLRLKIGINNL